MKRKGRRKGNGGRKLKPWEEQKERFGAKWVGFGFFGLGYRYKN